jgi:hypothetical protein
MCAFMHIFTQVASSSVPIETESFGSKKNAKNGKQKTVQMKISSEG